MATVTASDAAMLADITNIAGKLKELPKDVLLYIAGYIDGYSDKAALPHSVTAGGFEDGHV